MSDQINNEPIQKMLKYSKGEHNIVGEIYDYSHGHKSRFVTELGWHVQYFEIGFDTLVEAMDYINFENKDARPDYRGMQWLMIKNNLKSFISVFNLLSSGFYNDSMTILRSLFESIIRVAFITYHPEDKEATLYKPTEKGARKFNLTSFLQDELKVDWHYKLFSVKAHSNAHETLKDTIRIAQQGQKEKINIELKRDMEDISLSLNWLLFIMWNYIFFIKEFLIKDSKDMYLKLDEVQQGFHAIFNNLHITHPNNNFYMKFDEAIQIYASMKDLESKR